MGGGHRLRSAIVADPAVLENWVVYADWLSDRGDPRGELINLELAIEAGAQDPELVDRRAGLVRAEDALLSPRLRAEAHHMQLSFRRGFIDAAGVFGAPDDPPTSESFGALFADPHACMLERLTLHHLASLIAGHCCPSLRHLALVLREDTELPLAEVFPNLEQLSFGGLERHGRGNLEHLAHPHLRTVAGWCPALERGDFDLPSLVELRLGNELEGAFEPRAILMNPPPGLTALWSWRGAEFLTALRASPMLAQLRVLTIEATSREVDVLEMEQAAFSHVSLRCYATAATAEDHVLRERIVRLFPTATVLDYEVA